MVLLKALIKQLMILLSKESIRGFAACCYGRNEHTPAFEIRSALTFAHNAIGWSGKFMEDQLRDAHAWTAAAFAAEAQRLESVAELEFTYNGVQLDQTDDKPLTPDFFNHVV